MIRTSIPEKYHEQILQWKEEGKTMDFIVSSLSSSFQVSVSVPTVSRLIREMRKERQEIAKTIYSKQIEENAHLDIRIMNEVVSTLFEEFKKAKSNDNPLLLLKLSPELRAWTHDMRDLSGITKEEDDSIEQIKTEWMQKLNDKN